MSDDVRTYDGRGQIPVLRPQLPSAEQLLPYLRRIDASRIYSNWGPLVDEFEARITEFLSLPRGGFTSAASGTTALVAAILASAGRARPEEPLALLPAFTFIATAVAVEHCGYRPYITDVDRDSWLLEPDRLLEHPELEHVGLVVPVAPYGRPVPQEPWRRFRERCAIPVVIDGAAAFDRLAADPPRLLGEIPVAISFHATKSFGTGEGGGVATADRRLVEKVKEALNYGRWFGSRDSEAASANGKLSEYHAAVGLAELDGFDAKIGALGRVVRRYHEGLANANLGNRFVAMPEIGAAYVLFHCADPDHATEVTAMLERDGIGHRLWYGAGLHRHPYFASYPRDGLPVTDELVPSLIGLPLAPDLDDESIMRVLDALVRASKPLSMS